MAYKRNGSTAKITYEYTSARFYPIFRNLTLVALVCAIASMGWFYYKSTRVNMGAYIPNNIALNGYEGLSHSGQSVNQIIKLNSPYSKIPVTGTQYIPTIPSVFFKPAVISDGSALSAAGASTWKVYWNPTIQVQVSIALQWEPSGLSASNEIESLKSQLTNPSQTGSNPNASISATGNINGISIPNGITQQWQGSTTTSSGTYHYKSDIVIFNVDQSVAVVSMTAYGIGNPSVTEFQTLSHNEYNLLNTDPLLWLVYISVAAFILMVIFSIITFILKGRKGTRYMFVDLPKESSQQVVFENETNEESATSSDSQSAPQGWYHDPHSSEDSTDLRYFDGTSWTEHTTSST
jgi:hypothetical protein